MTPKKIFARILLTGLFLLGQGLAAQKPTFGIPDFRNNTKGNSDRSEPGAWKLPERSSEIAANEVIAILSGSNEFLILGRDQFSIELREEERAYSYIKVGDEALMQLSKDKNADYLILGTLNDFRVDLSRASAYGVNIQRVNTRASINLRIIDVATGEMVDSLNLSSSSTVSLPKSVSTSTTYDWVPLLQSAIQNSEEEILESVKSLNPAHMKAVETVSVSFDSSPQGADVIINGNFRGNTPVTLDLVPEKSVILVEMQGYQAWNRDFIPAEGMAVSPTLRELPKVVESKAKATDDAKETTPTE